MANNFAGDPYCKALWRFESGALTTDSSGNGNTLTAYGTPTAQDGKEGASAVELDAENGDGFFRTDDNLSLGFPLRSGDTNKKIGVCGWCNPATVTGDTHAVCGKGDSGKLSARPFYLTTGAAFGCDIGVNNGDSSEVLYASGEAVAGRWYHFGFTFDDATKAWQFVVWDDTAEAKVVDTGGTASNNINVEDAHWVVGAGYTLGGIDWAWKWDGLIDELVVFSRALSTSDIDKIRQQTYSYSGGHDCRLVA